MPQIQKVATIYKSNLNAQSQSQARHWTDKHAPTSPSLGSKKQESFQDIFNKTLSE